MEVFFQNLWPSQIMYMNINLQFVLWNLKNNRSRFFHHLFKYYSKGSSIKIYILGRLFFLGSVRMKTIIIIAESNQKCQGLHNGVTANLKSHYKFLLLMKYFLILQCFTKYLSRNKRKCPKNPIRIQIFLSPIVGELHCCAAYIAP